MATVTRNILLEGPSKIIVQLIIEGDNSGDLVQYSVLDPTLDFNPTLPLGTQLAIMQVWSTQAWFDMVMGFNAIAPTKAWVLPRDVEAYYDFRYFGGLKDQSNEDPDGKVLITTNGLDVGHIGSLIIEFKKN